MMHWRATHSVRVGEEVWASAMKHTKYAKSIFQGLKSSSDAKTGRNCSFRSTIDNPHTSLFLSMLFFPDCAKLPDDDNSTEAILILDGIHRWFAFKARGFKKIAAIEWKIDGPDCEKTK